MNKTSIEWTHRPETPGMGMTWNPIRARRKSDGKVGWACTHASTGCLHCYAETINKRFGTGLPFNVPSLDQVEFFLDEKILQQPLHQKKPATIFVGDMFDLFHEAMPEEFIGHVFGVMAMCPQHTFQLLTKRAAEMLDVIGNAEGRYGPFADEITAPWPVPNVWLGVSVENQKYADERIPLLLQTPAAVRFLSVEPMLEEIFLRTWKCACGWRGAESVLRPINDNMVCPKCGGSGGLLYENWLEKLDWIICGGESGPEARPFDLVWAESLLKQCRAAGVPFFMKQVGSNPVASGNLRGAFVTVFPLNRKGGDMSEWPEFLRVREFPNVTKTQEEECKISSK